METIGKLVVWLLAILAGSVLDEVMLRVFGVSKGSHSAGFLAAYVGLWLFPIARPWASRDG